MHRIEFVCNRLCAGLILAAPICIAYKLVLLAMS